MSQKSIFEYASFAEAKEVAEMLARGSLGLRLAPKVASGGMGARLSPADVEKGAAANILFGMELGRMMGVEPVKALNGMIVFDDNSIGWSKFFLKDLIESSGEFTTLLDIHTEGSLDNGTFSCYATAMRGTVRYRSADILQKDLEILDSGHLRDNAANNVQQILEGRAIRDFASRHCSHLTAGWRPQGSARANRRHDGEGGEGGSGREPTGPTPDDAAEVRRQSRALAIAPRLTAVDPVGPSSPPPRPADGAAAANAASPDSKPRRRPGPKSKAEKAAEEAQRQASSQTGGDDAPASNPASNPAPVAQPLVPTTFVGEPLEMDRAPPAAKTGLNGHDESIERLIPPAQPVVGNF